MAQKQLYLIFERLHIMAIVLRITGLQEIRNEVNLSRLTAAVIQKIFWNEKYFIAAGSH